MVQCTDILIVGGGFAGLSCFRSVHRRRRKVSLLTQRNHFLFSPLLPLAATGSVEVRSIVEPLWSFQKRQGEIIIGRAVDIDLEKRRLTVEFERNHKGEIEFKTLVLALGAITATHGVPGVEEHCF